MQLKQTKQPAYIIILLILAGEAVFILPFVLARIFRPTYLETFNISNLQLGTCFSVYGIVALLSYLFGGPLADKFHPRKLMSVALILTALGGFYLATYPSYSQLKILFGYWGFTTIFLFWAAMIKATRIWGGAKNQGKAFGFLDGGRGLVAAAFGSVGIYIFSLFIEGNIEATSLTERKEAFSYVIITSSVIICVVAILVYYFLKALKTNNDDSTEAAIKQISATHFKSVLKLPSVWLLMVIILCAYVGYKMTDVFSLYAKEVMLFDDIKAAKVGTYLLYMRPFIGVVIGMLADKTRASLWIIIGFLLMLVTSLIFSSGIINPQSMFLFVASIGFMALGVYAARVLYFATLEEGKIPLALTGTAVGLISIVGYTPDIFAGPAIGVLLDNAPGEQGHQHVFLMMAIFSFVGCIASVLLYRVARKNS